MRGPTHHGGTAIKLKLHDIHPGADVVVVDPDGTVHVATIVIGADHQRSILEHVRAAIDAELARYDDPDGRRDAAVQQLPGADRDFLRELAEHHATHSDGVIKDSSIRYLRAAGYRI